MKAYCAFTKLCNEPKKLLEDNGIKLTYNDVVGKIPNGDEITKLLEDYDILIIGTSSKITADLLKNIETPKIIATLSVGLDHIEKAVFDLPMVDVVNIKYANALSVAEHIFALILSLNKRIYESNHNVVNRQSKLNCCHERPDDISGKTLGLIGAGNITREVIRIASAFDMKMICHTKNPQNHKDLLKIGVEFTELDDVLKSSDIITLGIPLSAETQNLISRDKIALMKPTATFINAARTHVADTQALIEYADRHDTFYVGLDIDLDEHEELLAKYRKNVITTHHTAGASKQAMFRMELELAENIVKICKSRQH